MINQTISMGSKELEYEFRSWLANQGAGHEQKTVEAYISDIRVFYRWFNSTTSDPWPNGLLNSDLQQFANQQIKVDRVSAATWNRRRNSLRQFCTFLVQSGSLQEDPFMGIRSVKKQRQAPKSPDQIEFRRVMRKAEQCVLSARTDRQRYLAKRNLTILGLMAYAGLRECEVCELRPSNLLLSDRKSEIEIIRGKGGKDSIAHLSIEGRRLLDEWLNIRDSSGLLFGNLTTRQIQRVVADIVDAAGVDMTGHGFRHYFVHQVRSKTGDLQLAKELARHARIDQTLAYALPHADELQAAADLVSF